MIWNKDTKYDIEFSEIAEKQIQNILYYLLYEKGSAQAMLNTRKDFQETTQRLSHLAPSFKLCDSPKLRERGYHIIHCKKHSYFMLYKILGRKVLVAGVYHSRQDYEHTF